MATLLTVIIVLLACSIISIGLSIYLFVQYRSIMHQIDILSAATAHLIMKEQLKDRKFGQASELS